ncbi:MAG: hypothetical protein PHQ75_10205 [Thermoguttaceae bacterium]|nr:hypothetical protein [Thermoguttaceae bacterium]
MFRTVSFSIILLLGLGLAGCRACYSPYETCQPTFVPERGDKCMGELYRSGSVLGGMNRTKNDKECKSCQSTSEVNQYGPQPLTEEGAEAIPSTPATPLIKQPLPNETLPQVDDPNLLPQGFSLDGVQEDFHVQTGNGSFSDQVIQEVSQGQTL